MKLSQLEYSLPKSLIANAPVTPRDHSKLMVIDRASRSVRHKHFYDLFDLLRPSDVLVFNNTKVFPARLFGKKKSGGKVEVLFLKDLGNNVWEILGKNLPRVGEEILFESFYSKVLEKGLQTAKIKLSSLTKSFDEILFTDGFTPIPPYIDAKIEEKDLRTVYQTTYAIKSGSVAAPTAGLHFTHELLSKLKDKGVGMEFITLHVGPGTFLPIKEDDLSKHAMHSEWFSIDEGTAERLNRAKQQGHRIISVGTTTTRVLESCAINGKISAKSENTDIFIYPPHKFKFIDGLITNFHLPHSTLLALVSALVSYPNTEEKFIDFKSSLMGKAYKEAIENNYRFFSFGDSSIIL